MTVALLAPIQRCMGDLTYCFVDIEVDGPDPGNNSMLSFACVAHDKCGCAVAEFEANLQTLPSACPDVETAKWWQSQPEIWSAIRCNAIDPETALQRFTEWLATLPGDKAFVAHPLLLALNQHLCHQGPFRARQGL